MGQQDDGTRRLINQLDKHILVYSGDSSVGGFRVVGETGETGWSASRDRSVDDDSGDRNDDGDTGDSGNRGDTGRMVCHGS